MNRQDFEVWAQSHGASTDRTDGGEYRSSPTECAWSAWQAAIAKAATACTAIEDASLAKWHSDLDCNKYFGTGRQAGTHFSSNATGGFVIEHTGLDTAEALRKATAEVKEFNSATLKYVHGIAAGDLPMVGELATLVARLARKLRKATPSDELPAQALDYLNRNDLNGSPLREVGGGGTAVTRE